MQKWTIEIEEKDRTWPGLFAVQGGTFPLVCGMDGEEGIYCDSKEDLLLMAAAPELLDLVRKLADSVPTEGTEYWKLQADACDLIKRLKTE